MLVNSIENIQHAFAYVWYGEKNEYDKLFYIKIIPDVTIVVFIRLPGNSMYHIYATYREQVRIRGKGIVMHPPPHPQPQTQKPSRSTLFFKVMQFFIYTPNFDQTVGFKKGSQVKYWLIICTPFIKTHREIFIKQFLFKIFYYVIKYVRILN